MKKDTDIFATDFEIPSIVNQKMDDAFATIRKEGTMSKNHTKQENRENQRKQNQVIANKRNTHIKLFRNQVAAIIILSIVAFGSISVLAAYLLVWSRGMSGTLQSTEEQQQNLIDQGVATVFQQTEPTEGVDTANYGAMAVTNEGVTVVPQMMVANEKMVYLTFLVEGYTLADGEEPGFEFMDATLGEDPNVEANWLNSTASFYDGIVMGEDGNGMYADGSPLAFDEDGRLITYYTDENGNLELVMTIMVSDASQNLLGQTLHVSLTNFGTLAKTDFSGIATGEWDYAFKLTESSMTDTVSIGTEVPGSDMVLNSMEISPVSIKLNYTVNGEPVMNEDENGVPSFCGVILQDGTRLSYLENGEMSGYTDTTMSQAFTISAFDRVIEPTLVTTLLLRTEDGVVEVDIR